MCHCRTAGGEITLEYIDAERHAPDLSKTGDMFDRMVAFVGEHIKVDRKDRPQRDELEK